MKSTKVLLLIVVLGLSTSILHAQKLDKLIKEATLALYYEDFVTAYVKFREIKLRFPQEDSIDYHMEIAYHLTNGRGTPMDRMLSYEPSMGYYDKFYNFWLGLIHFGRYEFEISREHFDAFLQLEAYKSKEITDETQFRLEWAVRAFEYYDDPDYYEIEPISGAVNSVYSEISPTFFNENNELLFASSRPVPGYENGTVYQIYHSKKEGLHWSEPTVLVELGTFIERNAKVEVVNRDGRLFVYKEYGGGDLYFSEPTSEGWTIPVEFDSKIKNKLVGSHFFINDYEDHIIFSSDTENSGLDLFESKYDRSENDWGYPSPLSSDINSEHDEDYPYLSHDGKYLYFSSNKPTGVGGYDVYRSGYDTTTNSWSEGENLGFPINTIDDEIHFVLNPDNKTGYFSSNRLHSMGDYDIYYFHEIDKLITKGIISDTSTGAPLSNLTIKFHPIRYPDESFTATTDMTGRYEVNLIAKEEFVVEILFADHRLYEGRFESRTDNFRVPIVQDFQVMIPSVIEKHPDYASLFGGEDTLQVSTLDMLGSKFRVGQKAIIDNIYFAPQSDEIIADDNQVTDQIYEMLNNFKFLSVEIGGHTDNVGTLESNMSISLRRARKIANILIERGIDAGRIQAVGYGATQPLASNDDEVEGRELNRRIEITVIEI